MAISFGSMTVVTADALVLKAVKKRVTTYPQRTKGNEEVFIARYWFARFCTESTVILISVLL